MSRAAHSPGSEGTAEFSCMMGVIGPWSKMPAVRLTETHDGRGAARMGNLSNAITIMAYFENSGGVFFRSCFFMASVVEVVTA